VNSAVLAVLRGDSYIRIIDHLFLGGRKGIINLAIIKAAGAKKISLKNFEMKK